MTFFYSFSEIVAALQREAARKFATHPRTSLAALLIGGALLLLAITFWMASLFWPQRRSQWGSVAGRIAAIDGTPVANAIVLFVDDSAGVGASARTGTDGQYAAHGVQPGTYAVAVQPVVEVGNAELTREAVLAARTRLEAAVPARFQEPQTSGLRVELQQGRNRYDVDLSAPR